MFTQVVEPREFSQMDRKSPALRVLIVDDEPLIRWSLAEALGDCGYDIVETGDARGARSAIAETFPEFDVVLLDLRLPDSEDLSLLASIRQQSPHSKVILMTAFGTPEVTHRALVMGAFRVVGKPFEMHDLADLVAEAGAQ